MEMYRIWLPTLFLITVAGLQQTASQDVQKRVSPDARNSVTHEGVEVGGDEASTIYYCYRGQWLELQGND